MGDEPFTERLHLCGVAERVIEAENVSIDHDAGLRRELVEERARHIVCCVVENMVV